jgi:restriction system protein
MPKQLWVVRAGRDAIYVEDFLAQKMVAIGWGNTPDLTSVHGRDQVAAVLARCYPEYTKFQLSMNAGQVHRFRCELVKGETVLTYEPGKRVYHVGTIVGDYTYRPDNDIELRHTRAVKWDGSVERDSLTASTKNSLGSIATIFRSSEAASEEIVDLMTSTASGQSAELPKPEPAAEDDEIEVLQDTEQRAMEFLQDRLNKLSWDQMQELVAGLLRAMGYKTRVSPPGPDRGKDIVASPDGFGFESPRIVIEVKHRKGAMGAPDVRAFAGGLRNRDNGLYVSTGGFSREARYEADRANHPLTLIDSGDLGKAILDHYDRMDLETRTLLPLKKIYWPV